MGSRGNSNCRSSGSPLRRWRSRQLLANARRALPSDTRRRIGKTLALCTPQSALGAVRIFYPERSPIVVPKIEFRKIAIRCCGLTW